MSMLSGQNQYKWLWAGWTKNCKSVYAKNS